MIQDGRIADAIKASGIKNIMLMDDAFDVPTIDDAEYGPLFEYFETELGMAVAGELGMSEDRLHDALSQMSDGAYQGDEIRDLISLMHRRYVVTREQRFDPAAVFSSRLSNNLADIDPLLELLRRCKGVEIDLVGRNTPPREGEPVIPDLVFADFYLDGDITSAEEPSAEVGEAATSASVERLEELLGPAAAANRHPSVVLMSSKDVRGQADSYRKRISGQEGKVFASRFGFIMKSDIVVQPKLAQDPPQKPASIAIDAQAADVLLDIIQSHPFGNKLHEALTFWLASVDAGKAAMKRDIEALTLKEFAYLVTFRLAQEGMGLFDYLEWFFGECLLGAIGEAAADMAKRPRRNMLDKHAALIEGEFEKDRSDKIAELYHRAKIDARPSTRAELRLGDLYLERGQNKDDLAIWAVLTPDCDLIVRDGAMAAASILTVRGNLIPYRAATSALSEFIIIGKHQYSIDWKLKDLVTRETFEGMEFVGTLRPIYAQDLQKRALNDLARIGLAVAPVIRMEGTIALRLVRHDQLVTVDLGAVAMRSCEIFPSRGSSDKSRIILPRTVAENLLATLARQDDEGLSADGRKMLQKSRSRGATTALRTGLSKGVQLETDIGCGILVTDKMTISKGWCGIEILMNSPANQ